MIRTCRVVPFIIISLLVVSPRAQSQPRPLDTLYFYNHTKLVGKLRSIKLGFIEFDADRIGILRIKHNRITSMHAQSRNFRIETVRGGLLNGTFTRSYRPGWTTLRSGMIEQDIAIPNISTLNYYGEGLRSRMDGNFGGGFSYTKSSEIGRFNFNAKLRYSANNYAIQFQGDAIATFDSVAFVRENENMRLSYNYSFPTLWTAGGYANYQRNLELGLDHRWQEVLVGGRKFMFAPGRQALLVAGAALNQEANLEGVRTVNTEAVIQLNFNLFSFEFPSISLSLVQTGYASVTQPGRYRADGDINIDWELIKDFFVNLRFYHVYDTRSPATGEPNADWGTVAGVSYKF